MNELMKYKNYVLYGGGVMADRLSKQLDDSGMNLLAVADNYGSCQRVIKYYKGYQICNLIDLKDKIDNDTCVILAINAFFSIDAIKYFGKVFNENFDRLFVPNPYTCLRPCVMNHDFAIEERIPIDNPIYTKVRKLFRDDLSLNIYDLLWKSKTYNSETDSFELLRYSDIKDMYFFSEDYWKTYNFGQIHNHFATVFDCGAYIGDSIKPICSVIPETHVIYYAFEPEYQNASVIRNSKEFQDLCDDLIVLEYGVGEENKELSFEFPSNNQKDAGRFVDNEESDGNIKLQIKRIDDLNLNVNGQLYIKMDIEGAELSALKGAEKTIKKYSPYLAVCVYHRKNDLTDIPSFIDSLGCEYDFYLRGGFHTILWAIPKNT